PRTRTPAATASCSPSVCFPPTAHWDERARRTVPSCNMALIVSSLVVFCSQPRCPDHPHRGARTEAHGQRKACCAAFTRRSAAFRSLAPCPIGLLCPALPSTTPPTARDSNRCPRGLLLRQLGRDREIRAEHVLRVVGRLDRPEPVEGGLWERLRQPFRAGVGVERQVRTILNRCDRRVPHGVDLLLAPRHAHELEVLVPVCVRGGLGRQVVDRSTGRTYLGVEGLPRTHQPFDRATRFSVEVCQQTGTGGGIATTGVPAVPACHHSRVRQE